MPIAEAAPNYGGVPYGEPPQQQMVCLLRELARFRKIHMYT